MILSFNNIFALYNSNVFFSLKMIQKMQNIVSKLIYFHEIYLVRKAWRAFNRNFIEKTASKMTWGNRICKTIFHRIIQRKYIYSVICYFFILPSFHSFSPFSHLLIWLLGVFARVSWLKDINKDIFGKHLFFFYT